jgi:hypothetical protein
MRRYFIWMATALIPALAAALIISFTGCGGGTKPDDDDDKVEKGPRNSVKGSTSLSAVDASYSGTLTGKVTLDGAKPDFTKVNDELKAAMKTKEAHCVAASASPQEMEQQAWRIDANGGVENVFVWIVPPTGKFFKVDMNNKTWPDRVELTQPHCAFIKHCVVLFPKYYDEKTKKNVPSGQEFVVTNTSPIGHNTKIEGLDNLILPAGKVLAVSADDLKPSLVPIAIGCNIHTWMKAWAGVFAHPYATVTKADGTYEIKNVPVGVDVRIIAWHEEAGFLNSGGGKGEEIKFEEKSTKDFTAKAK